MENSDWMSAREAAVQLSVSKPQIYRLIQIGYLKAEKEETAPVPYYKIFKDSVKAYKNMPKNRGGRPKKKDQGDKCNS